MIMTMRLEILIKTKEQESEIDTFVFVFRAGNLWSRFLMKFRAALFLYQ